MIKNDPLDPKWGQNDQKPPPGPKNGPKMIKNDPQKGQKRGKKVLFLLAFLQEKREPSMYYWTILKP